MTLPKLRATPRGGRGPRPGEQGWAGGGAGPWCRCRGWFAASRRPHRPPPNPQHKPRGLLLGLRAQSDRSGRRVRLVRLGEGVRSLCPRKGWPQPPEGVAGGEGAPAAQKAGLCVPVGGPGSEEQADVRGEAILLYGDVLYSGGKKYQQALKSHAFQALVPLLFHLADSCPKVVMKTKLTFLRCAVLLKWEFRKELFGKLAWGRGLSAENDVFIYTVESNLGNYHRFLMQALTYLSSPDRNLKQAAMKFIGGMLQDYFPDLCICLRKADVRTLRKHLEILKQDPDSVSRRFYSSFLEDIWELSQYVTH